MRRRPPAPPFLFPLLLAALLLPACVAVRYPAEGAVPALAAGEGLVAGRVRVVDRGSEIAPWGAAPADLLRPEPRIRLSLLQVESGRKGVYPRIGPDGAFAWILPRGTYLLFLTRIHPFPSNEAVAAFQLPPGVAALHAGTVTLHLDASGVTGEEPDRYTVESVEAEAPGEGEGAALAARYPGLAGPVLARPVAYDPELALLLQNYSRKRCAEILGRNGILPFEGE